MKRCKALKISRPRRRRLRLELAVHGDRCILAGIAYSADFWVRNGMVERSTSRDRIVQNTIWGLVFTSIVSGCAHHADPVRELNSAVAPFTLARNQTVGLVATAKHSLGASDLNTLAVAYASLEEKGNAYAGFLVEAVTDTSFDADLNAKYASSLAHAIRAFNKSFASVNPASQARASVQSAWLPAFSDSVAAYWKQYNTAVATFSPQTKADLIKQLKAETVWPNYENIATEALATPSPH
jgi:hypothetical protein